MHDLTLCDIAPMSEEAIGKVRHLEGIVSTLPQADVQTRHTFHAGLYARTVCLPADSITTGCFIKIPTLLILSGDAMVYLGDEGVRLAGYHVLSASADRKQAFVAIATTYLTMIFPTEAKTIEEAEEEFTDEAHLLINRRAA